VRTSKNISIETLANISGMDYSQLARMEGGKVILLSATSSG